MSRPSAATGALLLPLLAACQLVEPMPPDQPCKEVGWAIAPPTIRKAAS